MIKNNPRLLIISNNSLSQTNNNGKTIESFFLEWDKEFIGQLYFYNELPESKVCKNFFRITDSDILKKIKSRKNKCGERVFNNINGGKESSPLHPVYSKKYNKLPIVRLLREILWSNKSWLTDDLTKWLDEYKPEKIFFCGGDSIFAYSITRYIKEKYNCDVIFYVTDDYVLPKFSLDPFYWIRLILIRHKFKWALNECKEFITISNEMSNEYNEKFNRKSTVAMNCVKIEPYSKRENKGNIIEFSYFGGLHYNRWKILKNIGIALDEINKDGIKARLNIYSNYNDNNIISQLNIGESCKFKGKINSDEVKCKTKDSDVLVFVEAFDKKSMHATKLSLSTKIPEYQASGRLIFAVGPEKVGSIKYLMQTNTAIICNSSEINILKEQLLKIIISNNESEKIIEKAYQNVLTNHSDKLIRSKIESLFL